MLKMYLRFVITNSILYAAKFLTDMYSVVSMHSCKCKAHRHTQDHGWGIFPPLLPPTGSQGHTMELLGGIQAVI